jgi:hypothetical protein
VHRDQRVGRLVAERLREREFLLGRGLGFGETGRAVAFDKLARERLDRQARELRAFSRDSLKINIEVLYAQSGQLTSDSRLERISSDHREEQIIVDDEHFMWKFNGEYWKDELGYYRFRIRSKCPKNN